MQAKDLASATGATPPPTFKRSMALRLVHYASYPSDGGHNE
jgi:hypothetical protein